MGDIINLADRRKRKPVRIAPPDPKPENYDVDEIIKRNMANLERLRQERARTNARVTGKLRQKP